MGGDAPVRLVIEEHAEITGCAQVAEGLGKRSGGNSGRWQVHDQADRAFRIPSRTP